MLKKSTFLSIFVLVFIGLGTPSFAHHKSGHGGGGGGGGGGEPTNTFELDAEFRDSDCGGPGLTDNLCSDHMLVMPARYVNGSNGITVDGGKFSVNITLNPSSGRSFFLDFNDCVAGCDDRPFPSTDFRGHTTGVADDFFSYGEPGFSILDDMVDGDVRFRIVEVRFRDGTNDLWRLFFNPDDCSGATEVQVTRDGNSWVFDSLSGDACLFRRKNGKGRTTFEGLYRIPFAVTFFLVP